MTLQWSPQGTRKTLEPTGTSEADMQRSVHYWTDVR